MSLRLLNCQKAKKQRSELYTSLPLCPGPYSNATVCVICTLYCRPLCCASQIDEAVYRCSDTGSAGIWNFLTIWIQIWIRLCKFLTGLGTGRFQIDFVKFGHDDPDPVMQDKNYFLWIISDGTPVKAHRNRQLSSGHRKRRRTFSLLNWCWPSSDSPMSIIVSVVSSSSSSDSTSSSRSPSTSSSSSVTTWCPTKTACPRIIWNTGEYRYWNVQNYYPPAGYLILLENTIGNH